MSNIKNLAIHQKTELPSNIEAEQTLIGSILENNEMFDEMKKRKQKYGMVTMCVGTGQGAAGIYELI